MAEEFDCQKIIDKIEKRFKIDGLDSLLAVQSDKESKFTVDLFDKDSRKPIALIDGNSSGNGILYIENLYRYGFGSNNSTKGAGLLLLDLVSCYAAKNNMQLTLDAMPNSVEGIAENNMRLYKFYNNAGLKSNGPERKVFGSRRKHYRTSANNLRQALQNRYKGGRRRRTRRR